MARSQFAYKVNDNNSMRKAEGSNDNKSAPANNKKYSKYIYLCFMRPVFDLDLLLALHLNLPSADLASMRRYESKYGDDVKTILVDAETDLDSHGMLNLSSEKVKRKYAELLNCDEKAKIIIHGHCIAGALYLYSENVYRGGRSVQFSVDTVASFVNASKAGKIRLLSCQAAAANEVNGVSFAQALYEKIQPIGVTRTISATTAIIRVHASGTHRYESSPIRVSSDGSLLGNMSAALLEPSFKTYTGVAHKRRFYKEAIKHSDSKAIAASASKGEGVGNQTVKASTARMVCPRLSFAFSTSTTKQGVDTRTAAAAGDVRTSAKRTA